MYVYLNGGGFFDNHFLFIVSCVSLTKCGFMVA
jgi:hypothetical protein